MNLVFGTLVGLVAVFALVGLAVMVGALRSARKEGATSGSGGGAGSPDDSLRARVARYVGPVDPRMALLNPPARVATEFFAALCGFPGLGWLLSGCVFTGLMLLCIAPAFIWGIVPMYLVVTGKAAGGAFLAVQYLPGLALGSAATLAYRETQLARRRKRKAQPSPVAGRAAE